MDKLNQPVTQNEKLRPNWGGEAPGILESTEEEKRGVFPAVCHLLWAGRRCLCGRRTRTLPCLFLYC